MKPVTIIHAALGISRKSFGRGADEETIDLKPGTQGEYKWHCVGGMVVLEIDGRKWVVHPGATDIK